MDTIRNFFLALVLGCCCSALTVAQVSVGSVELEKLKAGKFSPEDLSRLKATKTIFVHRPGDDPAVLEEAFKHVWTITPMELVSYSDFLKMDIPADVSIFSMGGVNTNTTFMRGNSEGINYDNTHIYLKLWMPMEGSKNKKHHYARIELHPTYVDYAKVVGEESDNAMGYLYRKGDLKNWQPGLLKNYLKQINDLLEAETEKWFFGEVLDKKEIRKLKNETLYIIDYAMVKFSPTSGDESKRHTEKKMMKSYPYKYEFITASELSDKILSTTEPFYYLTYVKSSTDKHVCIQEALTGKVVYAKYRPMSYNMKDADFKKIAAAIAGDS